MKALVAEPLHDPRPLFPVRFVVSIQSKRADNRPILATIERLQASCAQGVIAYFTADDRHYEKGSVTHCLG